MMRVIRHLLRHWQALGWARPPRTPTVLQTDAVECGAAALAIVLGFYGRVRSLESLRIDCGVSRDGSTAANVLSAARLHGLEASGRRLELPELEAQPVPLILFWQFNHFLVLEGFSGDWVYLNDPATGPRRVTRATFDRGYTGVALCCRPGPEFSPGTAAETRFVEWRALGGSLTFILIASLALALPTLAIPVFAQVFVDSVLIARLDGWVRPLLLGMALTAALRTGLTWLQQQALALLELRLGISWSTRFFWHVVRLPVAYFQQRQAADLEQRLVANDKLAQLLCGRLATDVITLLTMVLTLLIMLTYDVRLTLICAALMALNLLALRLVSRWRADASLQWQTDHGVLKAALIGALRSIETIKAGGAEAACLRRWSGQQAKVANTYLRLDSLTNTLSELPVLILAISTVTILWVGGHRVMAGEMTVGMLVGFQSLMLTFSTPVRNLMSIAGNFQQARASLRRVADVLRAPLEPHLADGAMPAARRTLDHAAGTGAAAQTDQARAIDGPATGAVHGVAGGAGIALPAMASAPYQRLQGWLELRALEFGYNRLEAPLIQDFSLRMSPGQRVALVGRSGCGKSTVARLVMGEMSPWSGEILFDGQRREQLAPGMLQASLAGVDQDIHMFDGSVRDNLTLWDYSMAEADMVLAAQDALIHDAIAARPLGYDATLSEDAANFSGGQRQRLEIARALSTNPRLLVLDEATASLDAIQELIIDENLRRRGCTCLIIAHRLSTIRDCDEIIVMERGRIAERGTHAQLMQQDGRYAELVQEQKT